MWLSHGKCACIFFKGYRIESHSGQENVNLHDAQISGTMGDRDLKFCMQVLGPYPRTFQS